MSDLQQVRSVMSLEARAVQIADVAGRADFSSPQARRDAVKAAALAHLQVVHARGAGGDGVTGE